jgi:predicted phosphodiesterase
MRIAALYDIHGNLPALDAVLHDVAKAAVDANVIGGDVLPGPMPDGAMARVLALDTPVHFIRGNGESAVLAELTGAPSSAPERVRPAIRWTAEQLSPDQRQAIAAWPATTLLDVDGLGTVLFCHATPRNDTEIFTALTPEEALRGAFAGVDAAVVICGHTHMQFDRMVGAVRVVNAGSVGMPFGRPGACWLLLGPDVQLRRTTYDLAAAAALIRRTSHPQAEEFAARNILQPPTEAEMQAIYARLELR